MADSRYEHGLLRSKQKQASIWGGALILTLSCHSMLSCKFFQPLSVELQPSSSLSTGWVVSLRGHFLPRWLRTGWQSVIRQGKIPWNTPPRLGTEPGPLRGQLMRYIHSPTKLSWLASLYYLMEKKVSNALICQPHHNSENAMNATQGKYPGPNHLPQSLILGYN